MLATKNALDWLKTLAVDESAISPIEDARPEAIDKVLSNARLGPNAVHQGLAAEVDDLPRARLKSACAAPKPDDLVVVLDQVTDPQNIGAVFRSAAAFGARAMVLQDRRTPPLAGALAKAAAGATETLPCVRAVNIARSLEALKDLGYHCAGLAGESSAPIGALPQNGPVALVLGAEGSGLRPLVRETCDQLYGVPISSSIESLNVSNAAAIAFYAARMRSTGARNTTD